MPKLIEDLLPDEEVSLIYGAPGVGKTRYLFQICQHILDSKDLEIDGKIFKCEPRPILYVSYDRSAKTAKRLLEKFGLINRIQWASYRNVRSPDPNLAEPMPLDRLHSTYPEAKIIIVDGMGMLIGDTNKYHVVSRYMRYVGTICELHKLIIIGNMHSNKEKSDSRTLNPRQKALGSTAFAGTTDSQIYLAHTDQTNQKDPNRILSWMPHDGDTLIQEMHFTEQGILVNSNGLQDKYDLLLVQLAFDRLFCREEVLDLGLKLGIAKTQIDAWLKKCVEEGVLSKPEYGKYQLRRTN